MIEAELEQYLHDQIPLSRAMAVRVSEIGHDRVVLNAPLAPNINHHDTVFGGSAASVATLAAWSLVHVRLLAAGLPSRIVIQRSTMEYTAPMAGEFQAMASMGDEADWSGFIRMLTRRNRARVAIRTELRFEGKNAGLFGGEFVAFRR